MENESEVMTSNNRLDNEKQSLLAKRQELIASFVGAVENRRPSKMGRVFQRLRQTNDFLDSLERIGEAMHDQTEYKGRRYAVSSLFLHECFKELTADRNEQFFFLTGAIVQGTYVLDQKLEFQHAKRSMVGVLGNHADTHRLLIRLEQFGHRLLAHFHSHPGNGIDATRPSGTDTGFQERLENAGYPTVAAIFSRDGYIRFFRLDNDLEIEIYGSGVEQQERIASVSRLSRKYVGQSIPGATDRQQRLAGFDQAVFSRSRVVCIGAGGLVSQIAPTLVRKGIGSLTILDDDVVEASNLNRQRFYSKDLGQNKAYALAENLLPECVSATIFTAYPLLLEDAIDGGIDLSCEVAICGVDNNPARVAASKHFRRFKTPVIFTAVSADADHGYVFIQEPTGPCFGCLFPDAVDSRTYACPATPAIADILQAVGALSVYAVDTCLMSRPRTWNYRRLQLSNGDWDSGAEIDVRSDCSMMVRHRFRPK